MAATFGKGGPVLAALTEVADSQADRRDRHLRFEACGRGAWRNNDEGRIP